MSELEKSNIILISIVEQLVRKTEIVVDVEEQLKHLNEGKEQHEHSIDTILEENSKASSSSGFHLR